MGDKLLTAPRAVRVTGHEGVAINVWDYDGGGRRLLLCHCTGTHGRVWDPLIPSLVPAFQVYAPDTRGHGDSETPEDPEAYHWIHTGRDLLAVIDGLESGAGLVAAGHSAGAAQIAYAEWLRPGTFSHAVLIDPIIGPAEFFAHPNPLARTARRRRNVFGSREDARKRFASKPPMKAWDSWVLDAYVQFGFADRPDGRVELKCPGPIEAAVYERGGASDLFEHLEDLALEVTLVTSDNSDVRVLAQLQRQRFRHCTYMELEGPSHFIPQERPAEIAALILERLS